MDAINYDLALARLDEAARIYDARRPLRQWKGLLAAGRAKAPEPRPVPSPRAALRLLLAALR